MSNEPVQEDESVFTIPAEVARALVSRKPSIVFDVIGRVKDGWTLPQSQVLGVLMVLHATMVELEKAKGKLDHCNSQLAAAEEGLATIEATLANQIAAIRTNIEDAV